MGDTFHESPIFLVFYQLLLDRLNDFSISTFFILIDIATSLLLAQVAYYQLLLIQRYNRNRIQAYLTRKKDEDGFKNFDPSASILLSQDAIQLKCFWVAAIYLLSPYSLLPCIAQSSSVLANFLISLALLMATLNYRVISLLLVSLLTLNSFYPLTLLAPVILLVEQSSQSSSVRSVSRNKLFSIALSLIIFTVFYATLVGVCVWLERGSFRFVQSTYVFM